MSKSEREKREAEREARRAERLAQRAEQRAQRKEEQAEHATQRAERLEERARRKSPRERELEESIEDLVDKVAEKWTKKAEDWIDEQSGKLFTDEHDDDDGLSESRNKAKAARVAAEKARRTAERAAAQAGRTTGRGSIRIDEEGISIRSSSLDSSSETIVIDRDGVTINGRAEREADDLEDHDMNRYAQDDDDGYEEDYKRGTGSRRAERKRKRAQRKRSRKRGRNYNANFNFDWGDQWGWSKHKRRRRGFRGGNLYRDKSRGKVLGVCAGLAEYFDTETWQIRLYAVLGMVFIPSVAVPAYFITYFLMDDKPYYRRVTDRFDDLAEEENEEPIVSSKRKRKNRNEPSATSNREAMKTAKEKFGDIENRLRSMESHVTSSHFELQREFRKISGEDS